MTDSKSVGGDIVWVRVPPPAPARRKLHIACGAFLCSALMLAGTSGGALKGALLLLAYSLGLGIPFLISAVLIDRLNTVFTFIKQHYKIVNFVSGLFLIITGVFMIFGIMNKILAFFS